MARATGLGSGSSSAASSSAPSVASTGRSSRVTDASDRLQDVLRLAHAEVERKVASEIMKVVHAQDTSKRELEEARARVTELQVEIDKLKTQKNYVSNAFEAQRKDVTKLRTENQMQNEELVRLRRAVEELQSERAAVNVGRKAVDADLAALEVEQDILGRALGAATRQLFGRQQAAAGNADATPSKKGRPAAAKGKVAARSGSPRSSTPTGGAARRPSIARC